MSLCFWPSTKLHLGSGARYGHCYCGMLIEELYAIYKIM